MTRDRIRLAEAASLVAVLTLSGASLAQDEGAFPEPEPSGIQPDDQPAEMDYGISAGEYWYEMWSEFSPSGELGDGDVETWRTGAELGVMYPLAARDRLWIQFRSEYTNSDFNSIDEFVPDGDLYDNLLEYTLSVTSTTAISDRWSVLLRASGTSAGEAHADFDETITFRGVVGAAYTINSNLQIGLAAAASSLPGIHSVQQLRNPMESLPRAVQMSWQMTMEYLEGLGKLFTGEVGVDKLAGPIGIARIARKSLDRGWLDYLSMMMLISINLGILNLLPIPILDGGQAVIYAIEGIKRSPLSMRSREIATSIGFGLLVLLMGRAFWNDLTPTWLKFVSWLSNGSQ